MEREKRELGRAAEADRQVGEADAAIHVELVARRARVESRAGGRPHLVVEQRPARPLGLAGHRHLAAVGVAGEAAGAAPAARRKVAGLCSNTMRGAPTGTWPQRRSGRGGARLRAHAER